MKVKSSRWSIGQVAEPFGLPTNVLRHWESVGLLTPERDRAGRRWFGRDDVTRIAVIQRSKAAGMTLEQIGNLLDAGAPGRHVLLEEHVAELDRRMEEVRVSREMTLHALSCRAHDVTTCPHFRGYVEDLMAAF